MRFQRSGEPLHVEQLKIFKTSLCKPLMRSVLLNGAPARAHVTTSNMRKSQVVQNKVNRNILKEHIRIKGITP